MGCLVALANKIEMIVVGSESSQVWKKTFNQNTQPILRPIHVTLCGTSLRRDYIWRFDDVQDNPGLV